MFQFSWSRFPVLFWISDRNIPTFLGIGCPIRTSPDQSLFAAPRGLSQLTTSFIAYQCQVIHHEPLVAWPSWNFISIFESVHPFCNFGEHLRFVVFLPFCAMCCQRSTQKKHVFILKRALLDPNQFILLFIKGPIKKMDLSGVEPLTSWLQIRRSPNWTTGPY